MGPRPPLAHYCTHLCLPEVLRHWQVTLWFMRADSLIMYGAVQAGVRERIPDVGCDTVDQSPRTGADSSSVI